MCLWV
jgi:hypothetical protein